MSKPVDGFYARLRAFLRPILAGKEYRASLRIAGGVKSNGHMRAVFDIRDEESRVCVYANTDILLR